MRGETGRETRSSPLRRLDRKKAHLCPPLVRLVANGLLVQLAVRMDVRTNVRNLVTVLEPGCDRVHGGLVGGAAVGGSTVDVVGGSLGVGHALGGDEEMVVREQRRARGLVGDGLINILELSMFLISRRDHSSPRNPARDAPPAARWASPNLTSTRAGNAGQLTPPTATTTTDCNIHYHLHL